MRCVSGKKTQATHMPKSAITISDGSLVWRERVFSSLFTSHTFDPNILPKMGRGMIRKRDNILEILVDDAVDHGCAGTSH